MAATTKTATKTAAPANKGIQEVPAGTDKATKKAKKKRVLFGERGEDKKLKTKITGKVVEGWSSKEHLPLRKDDFAEPADFLEWKADRLERSVKNLREQAVAERGLGNAEQRKAAKKMASLVKRFNAQKEEMKKAGMSDEQIAAFMNG